MMIVWCKDIKNIDFDSEFEMNFAGLKSHSVTKKWGKVVLKMKRAECEMCFMYW